MCIMYWHLHQLDVIIMSLRYGLHSLVCSSRFQSITAFVACSTSNDYRTLDHLRQSVICMRIEMLLLTSLGELSWYVFLVEMPVNTYSMKFMLNSVKYCNGFDQRVARQQLWKHGPTLNNRGNCVFFLSAQLTYALWHHATVDSVTWHVFYVSRVRAASS
jgi:hypothetical protein